MIAGGSTGLGNFPKKTIIFSASLTKFMYNLLDPPRTMSKQELGFYSKLGTTEMLDKANYCKLVWYQYMVVPASAVVVSSGIAVVGSVGGIVVGGIVVGGIVVGGIVVAGIVVGGVVVGGVVVGGMVVSAMVVVSGSGGEVGAAGVCVSTQSTK